MKLTVKQKNCQECHERRRTTMKTKLFLMSATLLAALSLTGVASADTTRDQIEAEGNQQIQAYWNEYQQALQDRQNAWEQSHGDIYTPAWQDANAHAGAAYREWLEARTALGDRLHAYDVAQWEKESDQPSNQTPVDDSQVPEENSQALNTQGSQATVPTSQSATPASQAKLSSQPATQELTQQASMADPASQPITQSTAQKPQQASVSVQADKTGNLPAQNKKPVQERTEQSSVATLPQTGNQAGLGAISIGIASALAMFGLAGVKVIRRTRKCQIERAKFMDHTGYEWSQWWHSKSKNRRRKKRQRREENKLKRDEKND